MDIRSLTEDAVRVGLTNKTRPIQPVRRLTTILKMGLAPKATIKVTSQLEVPPLLPLVTPGRASLWCKRGREAALTCPLTVEATVPGTASV